ncbi:helix-turn-helix domain-containing protein [Denitratisoma oestradiolicum]|uniref:HTH cro/C1-type domain-containing protein n=1 Tax=Denitratisoma oestradiolicum TaxID=311182 RepID=A0A6S6XWY7_9PROT|nr:helix-turn-helix transcriptional regulator [Denitratisoma oestradiolicum]TWO81904.1 hypothetical protein CBW56_00165 [Denitratisoma oestradiolicum]CAB1368793.1 conserved protein of unknown function [Denitratisoma oestradiolicum]
MSSIATVLKEEIARQARKELRNETEGLKKASGRYRSEIAALKRRIGVLEQQLARLTKLLPKAEKPLADGAPSRKLRFSGAGLKKMRERLDLTASVLASILQVSTQTIYNWEADSTHPSQEQIAKIAALRKMGKRKVRATLAQLSTGR